MKQNKNMSMKVNNLLLVANISYLGMPVLGQGSETELEEVFHKLESDARAFAAEMERVFAEDIRCSDTTFQECLESSFHECDSVITNTECVSAPELARQECSVASSGEFLCTGRYGFSSTSVRLAPYVTMDANKNPTDPGIKESLCFSKKAEEYMINKYYEDQPYWMKYGVTPPPSYFGSVGGMFRYHPAKPSENAQCGNFDTARRPWFVAATSGPKDVVLILDLSGSMNQRERLALAREAAYRVIDTLTGGDRVGVVVFSDEARTLNDRMLPATRANKDLLKNEIDKVYADGGTNFLAAFNVAFDLLAESEEEGLTTGCSSAFLFLTDGEMTVPQDTNVNQVISSIMQRTQELTASSPQIFMYGLGTSAASGKAAEDPKSIACATQGMWSHVEDGGDLASSMANYYKRFALGLGVGNNTNFVSWVDPYIYGDGYTVGTSVSAPVFDRSVDPPVLVGAVGLDIPISVMDKALGVAAGSRETLKKLVSRSTAMCPSLSITNCVLQSLRLEAGSEESLCNGECNATVGIQLDTCPNGSSLPSEFWANTDSLHSNFVDRACCAVGEIRGNGLILKNENESQQCMMQLKSLGGPPPAEPTLSAGAIAGIVIGAAACLIGVGLGIYYAIKACPDVEEEKELKKEIPADDSSDMAEEDGVEQAHVSRK